MTTGIRRRVDDQVFDIHEDVRTEETEVIEEMEDEDMGERRDDDDDLDDEDERATTNTQANRDMSKATHTTELRELAGDYDEYDEEEEEEEEDDEQEEPDFDASDNERVDSQTQSDMDKLESDFPGFRQSYRLIKRIGEGTFSTVYKAEDKRYDKWQNDWDIKAEASKWVQPPLRRDSPRQSHSPRKRTQYVAIKKIYVTSSPARILNELELLHVLRGCPSICPLITAFRHTDQVIAILPYFRHGDFRHYFRDMTIPDIRIYLRALFTALKSTHDKLILHRDIKPTNFLYDPATQHGVLVDFGLAEPQGTDTKPCMCHDKSEARKNRQLNSVWAQTAQTRSHAPGYPKVDTRPSKRANRAGTRGFRAPEVLFKCTEQTTAIDIWSAGVILLTILSKRFPFFNSSDDVEATIEIATIFGVKRMRSAALRHGCIFETTIPTIGQQGFTLEKIILWSTCRGEDKPLTTDEKLAVNFLERCMELDAGRRITAEEALKHEFLRIAAPEAKMMDDEMDILDA